MVVQRADRWRLPLWPLGDNFSPDLGGVWRGFQRPDKKVGDTAVPKVWLLLVGIFWGHHWIETVIFTHPHACWFSCALVFITLHWIIDAASMGGKDLKDSCCSLYCRKLTNSIFLFWGTYCREMSIGHFVDG